MRWLSISICALISLCGCTAINALYGDEEQRGGTDSGTSGSGPGESSGVGTESKGTSTMGSAGGTESTTGATASGGTTDSTSNMTSGTWDTEDGASSGGPTVGPAPTCPDGTDARPEPVEAWIDAFFVRGADDYAGGPGDDLNYGATATHSLYGTPTEAAAFGMSFGPAMPNSVTAVELRLPLHGAATGGLEIWAANLGFGEGVGDGDPVLAGGSSWNFRFSPEVPWSDGPAADYGNLLALEALSDLSVDPLNSTLVRIPLDLTSTLGHYQGDGGSILVLAPGVAPNQLYLDSKEAASGPVIVFWVC